MFTGLIEEVGEVIKFERQGRVTIRSKCVLEGTQIGDSIATAGICLTVVSMTDSSFTAEIMPETLKKSHASTWRRHTKVNLERALQVGRRLGGHEVSGHVDQTAVVVSVVKEKNARRVRFALENAEALLEPQGSIAIDGVSLTVAQRRSNAFEVSLIPLTVGHTTFETIKVGQRVNLEFQKGRMPHSTSKKITKNFLLENGF